MIRLPPIPRRSLDLPASFGATPLGRLMRAGIVFALLLAGCSNAVESTLLRIEYKPPRGFKLLEESAGPPARARFSAGLEIASVTTAPPPVADGQLAAALVEARRIAEVASSAEVLSSRPGTVPAGPVARWTLRDGQTRTLLYLIAMEPQRFLVLKLSAPASDYDALERRVELSLSSLRPMH